MTRMLLLAMVSLAATHATVVSRNSERTCARRGARDSQSTAIVGQGVVQGTGQAGQGIAQGSASVAQRCWSGHCRSCERRGHGGGQDRQRRLVHCNAGLRLLSP